MVLEIFYYDSYYFTEKVKIFSKILFFMKKEKKIQEFYLKEIQCLIFLLFFPFRCNYQHQQKVECKKK